MWISKKKFQAALEDVKWKQVDYNVKMRHEERQNERISNLEKTKTDWLWRDLARESRQDSRLDHLEKQVKKLKKYIKEGY